MEELKKLIKKNKEVNEVLLGCSDNFLLENKGMILAAISEDKIIGGYKIQLSIKEDILEWRYIPDSEDAKNTEQINYLSHNYKYKLPDDWKNFYLINLNDVHWTEDKRILAKACKKIIINIENNPSKGFWLYGLSNTGKSYSAIALLNMLANKGKTVAFVNVGDLISKTQDSFNNKNYSSNIENIKKADYIVIDDLGSERPTPWFKENILLPIIDYRVKSRKTTIFTSNSSIDKYRNKLKYRSQNPEVEEDTNDKIITRIKDLISEEIKIG